MMPRLLRTIICLAVGTGVTAFSTTLPSTSSLQSRRLSPILRSSAESATAETTSEGTDDEDVVCYVTNDEEIVTEGEKPHVVCTSEPEEVS